MYFRVRPKDPLVESFKPGVSLIQERAPGDSLFNLINSKKITSQQAASLYDQRIRESVISIYRDTNRQIQLGDFGPHNVFYEPHLDKIAFIDLDPEFITFPKIKYDTIQEADHNVLRMVNSYVDELVKNFRIGMTKGTPRQL